MRQAVPSLWKPHDIELESAAETVVREIDRSTVIIAGPGSGKTELLAQKACFLLETGTCPPPYRILAVCFKRDAARNLKERVVLRSGQELASRFNSLTFDAFSKGLLDRFRGAVPALFRPSLNYHIDFSIQNSKEMRNLLRGLPPREDLTTDELNQINETSFEARHFGGEKLSSTGINGNDIGHRTARALWHYLLHEQAASRLSFRMIGRIVDLLFRKNPYLVSALQQTYPFVFLDEFQDTTSLQYDLTHTCFSGTQTNLTAVGDPKQRIMAWAGALHGIFATFQKDFGAIEHRLCFNFRSAPRLVLVQNSLVAALEGRAVTDSISKATSNTEGECLVLRFPDHKKEAQYLAKLIASWITCDGLRPRDVCIITRQKVDQYTGELIMALGHRGVQARIESDLQDLLAEPVTTIVLCMLRLLVTPRCANAWQEIVTTMVRIRGFDTDEAERGVQHDLENFIKSTGSTDLDHLIEGAQICNLIKKVVDFIGLEGIKSIFPHYQQGTFLSELLLKIGNHLSYYRNEHEWSTALDFFEGNNSIPIMTIHKSKGLEYHTVIFVGLEDSALWNYKRNSHEETCNFFVAFSRAKERVIFTFCQTRLVPQKTQNIAPLYHLLHSAGVEIKDVE